MIPTTNTLYGIVTDNRAMMFAAKYTWEKFRLFAGYEYIRQSNPTNPLGVGAPDQGGYIMSGVEDNNLDSPKHVQIWWTGGKYAIDKKTDITAAWYHQLQNDFRVPTACTPSELPGFLRGQPQRGVDLSGSSLHPAFRRFCRRCAFLRKRRSGHCHSAWSRRPVSLRHQPRSDHRRPFQLLMVTPRCRRGRRQRSGGTAPQSSQGVLGIVKENRQPLPISDSTQIRPPWRSTIILHSARPIPLPG